MDISSLSWNNYKSPISGMDKYGKQRLKLAILLRDQVLPKSIPWTIENGSLLGAWRNGKFITHDDDFDIAVYFTKNAKEEIIQLLDHIKDVLPEPYQARLITSYCTKIEVFDPSYGKYISLGPQYGGADYHHVSADIQAFQLNGDQYDSLYYVYPRNIVQKASDIFPIGSITLEGEVFNAPHNVEGVLQSVYGSLSDKAKYNPETGIYEDPTEMSTSEDSVHA